MYYGQPALAGTSIQELEDFVGTKFYCPHALAGGNRRIRDYGEDTEVLNSVIYTVSIHTRTHPFNGLSSGTTRVSQYQKGKTNLDFTEATDSEWQCLHTL